MPFKISLQARNPLLDILKWGACASTLTIGKVGTDTYYACVQYNGDYKPLLEGVRQQLNETAEGWTREEKDHCLDETQMSFRYSNGLLRCIFE